MHSNKSILLLFLFHFKYSLSIKNINYSSINYSILRGENTTIIYSSCLSVSLHFP